MRYAMMNGLEVERQPNPVGVQGYLYNHGGLNNQKMALIGLILSELKDGQAINLPYIYNRDQKTDVERVVRFEEIFDLGAVKSFAERHGLTVLAQSPSGERGGWNYFQRFQDDLNKAADRPALDVILDSVACLKPRIAFHPGFIQMRDFARRTLGIDTVVQLRIETDWQQHADVLRRSLRDPEDNGLGFMQILAKIKHTFPDLRIAYATSDEPSLPAPKDEIRTICRQAFGIELLWKSDLLPVALQDQLTPLDLSMIDFEIARSSRRFIGLTSSTFANMLSIEKLAETRQPVRGHYIYNCPGDVVRERLDNGYTAAVRKALLPSRADALLA